MKRRSSEAVGKGSGGVSAGTGSVLLASPGAACSSLETGAKVEIACGDLAGHGGVVDTVTEDGSVLGSGAVEAGGGTAIPKRTAGSFTV